MDKALNYLALARKGGMAELGEEPVGAAARAGKAHLIVVGFAIGRTSLAIAAITDAALALALVQSLGQPERCAEALEVLTAKTQKTKQRRREASAHLRNKRRGKKK